MARASTTMLNKSGESGHPCLVLGLRENAFSFSLLRMMLAVGLSYMVFIVSRYVPSILTLLRVFNHKWMLNFTFLIKLAVVLNSFSFYLSVKLLISPSNLNENLTG